MSKERTWVFFFWMASQLVKAVHELSQLARLIPLHVSWDWTRLSSSSLEDLRACVYGIQRAIFARRAISLADGATQTRKFAVGQDTGLKKKSYPLPLDIIPFA